MAPMSSSPSPKDSPSVTDASSPSGQIPIPSEWPATDRASSETASMPTLFEILPEERHAAERQTQRRGEGAGVQPPSEVPTADAGEISAAISTPHAAARADDDPTVPSTPHRRSMSTEERKAMGSDGQTSEFDLNMSTAPVRPVSTMHPVTVGSRLFKAEGFSKFEFSHDLGRGGMGVVKRATDRELRREVAIKMLLREGHAEAVARFIEEAQITGQLEHPNIVPVHELGVSPDGRPFMAMKLVRGQTLRDLIEEWKAKKPVRLRPEDLSEILEIVKKVCDAIGFAHDHGVIHRDIKVDNIMVGRHGEVQVMDWGLAKPLARLKAESAGKAGDARSATRLVTTSERESSGELTVDGRVVGTLAYMPPEQARGEGTAVDERSDIFALAGVLHHMLTYQRPFTGANMIEVLQKVIECRTISPRKVAPERRIPRELNAIVKKAMAKNPADRYQTVAEFEADLTAFQTNRLTSAYRYHPISRTLKWLRRHPTFSLVTIVITVAGLIAGYFWLRAAEFKRDFLQEQQARQEQELETLQTLARQGEIDKVVKTLGVSLAERRDKMLEEFQTEYRFARERSDFEWEFVGKMGRARIGRFIWAFEELLDARTQLGEAISVTADDYYYLGLLYLAGLSHRERAAELVGEAVRLRPDFVAARVALGDAMPNPHTKIRAYTEALALDPQNADVYVRRGREYAADGAFARAEADFAKALELAPYHARAHVARGRAFAMQGKLELAEAAFSAAIASDPAHVPAYVERGQVRIELKDFVAAERDFTSAVYRDPGALAHFRRRAHLYLRMGRIERAIDDFSAVLVRDPTDAEARLGRADARIATLDLAGAITDFQAVLEFFGGPDSVRLQLASTFEKAERTDEAMAVLNAAIEENPRFVEGVIARAELRLKHGDSLGAVDDFTTVLKLDSTRDSIHRRRAEARLSHGDTAGAIADYSEWLHRDPGNVAILLARSQARLQANDTAGALKDTERAARDHPQAWEAWLQHARLLARIGQRESAREAFSRALLLCPPTERAAIEKIRRDTLSE